MINTSSIKNQYLINWVNEIAALTKPASIHFCDGTEAENKMLIDLMVASGTLKKLNEALQDTKKTVKNALASFLPERLLTFYLDRLGLTDCPSQQLSQEQVESIRHLFKHFTIKIHKTLPLEKSFVTGGGIHLKEINPKKMET